MAFSYFSKLPVIEYPLDRNRMKRARDILHRPFTDQKFVDKSDYIQKYRVQDGDRPEIISNKLYGRPDIYSIIMLLNDFDTSALSGLPPSAAIYEDYLDEKYSDDVYYLLPVPSITTLYAGTGTAGGYVFPLLGYSFNKGERVFAADAAGFQIYGTRAYVKDWDARMSALKLDVLEGDFTEGTTIANEDGTAVFIVGYRTKGKNAVHHFEGTTFRTDTTSPVVQGMVIDPLSRADTLVGGFRLIPIGLTASNGTTGSWGTSVIRNFIFRKGNDTNPQTQFYKPVTFREWEERVQERKREISVPVVGSQARLGEVISRFTDILESIGG